ncbi:MAG TPA: hypothetical protein VE988_08970, partial [Gemmataceae bacterium]|nr:hypothetical protein [Gemmataceae bacterium]
KNAGELDHWVVDDLLLVLPKEDAVILCYSKWVGREHGIAKCKDDFLKEFKDMNKTGLSSKQGAGWTKSKVDVNDARWPPKKGKIEMVELLLDKKTAGEDKTFLVRIVRRDNDDRVYVVICGVKRGQMHRVESQFREALDSFRLLDRLEFPDR